MLEYLLWQRQEDTYDDIVRSFEATARELNTDVTLGARHLSRLASGQRRTVSAPTRRVLQRMFGVSVDQLLQPYTDEIVHGALTTLPQTNPAPGPAIAGAGAEKAMVSMAAQRARKFSTLNNGALPAETMEQILDDLRRLALDYQVQPLHVILGDLVDLQDTIFTLLEQRQRPQDARQLFLAGGVVGGLLAKASHDVAEPHAAATQARTAYVCADSADHHGLRAWLRGMQALIAYWAGRHHEAIRYAQHGQQNAALSRGSASVWLPVSEARSWAALGNAEAAKGAIQRAEEAANRVQADELDELGGICTFGRARQLYYTADAYAWLPAEEASAEHYGTEAVAAYREHPQEWAFGDSAGSATDLAVARIQGARPDLEGAADALAPVLELPPAQRINGIVRSVYRVHDALSRSPHAADPLAQQLQEQIETFTRVVAASSHSR
ncbi:hypothetical protein [Actinocatenispora rupis]|uniref:hypothetical protein n=1 Tax=Actinocatenispora rupis TaxID=519421 RepID=UPI001EF326D7|nr:hypothetical protein [Actinocatenispora rupis]